jgi:uncharacterized repeat protein (TIGR01451 family)
MVVLAMGGMPHSGHAANPSNGLRIEVIAAYNLVVDSNVEAPSTYAPRAAYLGAKIYNDGTNDLAGVTAYIGNYVNGTADTPGVYPTNYHPSAQIAGPINGAFALTHAGGSAGLADATRYIGAIKAGESVTMYWLVSYPNVDTNGAAVWGPSVKPDDDLKLYYDIWASGTRAGAPVVAETTRDVTMRNEISAMANKIFPNTANKVPLEYQQLLERYAPAWTNIASDGSAGTLITTEGVWYDLGNVGEGFDNNGDLAPDHNLWMQPVGDSTLFDAGAFRLVKTYALVVVKLKTGGDYVYMAEDQLYFQNVPENNGAVGYVAYQFMALGRAGSSQLTPYQEVASGRDNEKFNGDYGATIGGALVSPPPNVAMSKGSSPSLVDAGSNIAYAVSFTNTGAIPLGNAALNVPLVIQDRIPAGTVYVAGSATNNNTAPTSTMSYLVFYSTNNATSWQSSEPSPATAVTHLQWWLSDTLQPAASGTVRFSTTLTNGYAGPPLIVNVAGLSIGSGAPFLTADATNRVTGTNRWGDAVFRDEGAGAFFGNGVQDAGEAGISNVQVRLYYDANANGAYDAADPLVGTTLTGANGVYGFTNLPSGRYVSVVDITNANLPQGYTLTTASSHGALLGPGGTNAYLSADYGFAPALTLTKQIVGTNLIYEGRTVSYTLDVRNPLPGDGMGLTPVIVTNILYPSAASIPGGGKWESTYNATGAPDNVYTTNRFNGTTDILTLSNLTGSAWSQFSNLNVKLVLPIVVAAGIQDDNFNVAVRLGGGAAITVSTNFMTNTLSQTLVLDISGLTNNWSALTNANTAIAVSANGNKKSVLLLDSVGVQVVSTQYLGSASSSTILKPVPLYDTYDTNQLQFVSATPAVTTHTFAGSTGALYWADLGPIYPGGSNRVSVTFTVLQPLSNLLGSATNTATVTNALFMNGLRANTATSQVTTVVRPTGMIGDFVWRDLDGDGIQDGGNETGISGVQVVLDPPANADAGSGFDVPVTNVTDATGFYLFTGIYGTNAGSYTITVLTNTLPGATPKNTFDLDNGTNAPNSLVTTNFNPAATDGSDVLRTVDFGYQVQSRIEGTVWNDVNRNGAHYPESGEGWIPGVTVYLYTNLTGDAIATNQTDANGFFSFTGNYTGSYVVGVATNTGALTNGVWVQTYDSDVVSSGLLNQVTVTVPGGGGARADFSYYQGGAYLIGDQLFYDWNSNGVFEVTTEEGIAFITVSLFEDANSNGIVDVGVDALVAVTQTSTNGVYTFTNLPSGTYQVIVDQADAQFPPLYLTTYDPYGAKDGRSVVAITTAVNTNQDFGYWPYGAGSIGDTVWLDSNADGVQFGATEVGLSNITVRLFADFNGDGATVLLTNTVTDAGGRYLFANLPDGAYRVQVDAGDADLPKDAFGYAVAPTTSTNLAVVLSGADRVYEEADFGFAKLAAVGDTVFQDLNANGTQDGNEAGISNVTVRLYHDANTNGVYDGGESLVTSRVTTNNGTYLFAGVPAGYYVVLVDTGTVGAGWTLTADPNNDGAPYPTGTNYDHQVATRLLPGGNFMGADFGYQPPGVIGDTLWFDVNTNGVRDAGEYGIPYVTVELWSNGTRVATNDTDADGYYGFGNLGDGTYEVRVLTNDTEFPVGVTNIYAADNTLDHQASAIVISNRSMVSVGGLAFTNNLGIDFGYRYAGANSLSGTIGLDAAPYDGLMGTNGTGVTSGEVPFASLTVYAYLWRDLDSNGVIGVTERILLGSTATDANGDYRFTGLPEAIGTGTNRYLVSTAPPLGLDVYLTTTNGYTADRGVVNSTNLQGVTVGAYQVVPLAAVSTNVDFAFAPAGVFDFGDLPSSYGTLITDSPAGARHKVKATPDLYLGATVDTELNGQPSAGADGDDSSGTDDEDGVTAVGDWGAGTGRVQVVVGAGSGWLCGYLDFNRDGNFADSNELFVSQAVTPGTNTTYFAVPSGTFLTTQATSLFARFRLFPSEPLIPEAAYSGLANNGEVEDYRFQFSALGDTVWLDRNANGIRDAGEAPLAGVKVYADLNNDGVWAANEPYGTTDTNGLYGIGGLTGGSYVIRVATNSLPAGVTGVYDLDGTVFGVATVSLSAGAYTNAVDFGYRAAGVIGDRVWLDENSDGIQDAGEAGIANVTVGLYDTNGAQQAVTTTDTEGGYLFTGLLPGTYEVRVLTHSLAAGLAANPTFDWDGTNTPHVATVTLAAGQTFRAADFGYNWASSGDVLGNTGTGAIGDRVWVDADGDGRQDPGEPGLGGVTVALVNLGADGILGTADDTTNTTTTAADGGYGFDGLAAGAYSVIVTAGTNGYTQTGDPDGMQDNRTTPPILLAPGDVYVNADFGYQPDGGTSGSIGDRVWCDADADGVQDPGEPEIPGVTVALIRDSNANGTWDEGEPIIATTVTGTNGLYAFSGLPVTDGVGTDDYLVWVNDIRAVLAGLAPTYDSNGIATANLSAVADLTSAGNDLQDFGYTAIGQAAGKGLIGDTIFLDRNTNGLFETGEGLQGVTVGLYDSTGTNLMATTTTGPNGAYAFGGLDTNGVTYVVRVDTNTLPGTLGQLTNTYDPDNGTANEASVTLTGASPINLAQDFGYADASSPNTISGTAWTDTDADGTLEAGETNGLAGVTIVLTDTNGNRLAWAVTDAQGNYSFSNLPDGTFRVDVTDDANVLNGYWHSSGTNAGADNNSQSDPYTVTVSGGQTNTTADFGYYVEGAALGNRVWFDADQDGVQDAAEIGLDITTNGTSNVKIVLTVAYPDGTTHVVVTTTVSNGYYGFRNLLLDEHYDGAGAGEPAFTLSVVLPGTKVWLTTVGATNQWLDSNSNGTVAVATKGTTDVSPLANPANEPVAGSYDFGLIWNKTLARLTGFRAFSRDGQVVVTWDIAEELGTAGYDLERWVDAGYQPVNADLIEAYGMGGGTYEQVDAAAPVKGTCLYRLIELETSGNRRYLGPFTVTVDGPSMTYDEWSRVNFSTDVLLDAARSGEDADADGDGMSNLAEFLAGTEPANPLSALRIVSAEWAPGLSAVLKWNSVANRRYVVEVSTNLDEGFEPVIQGVEATAPLNEQPVASPSGAGPVFYRVRIP